MVILLLLPDSNFCNHFEYSIDNSPIADEELEDSDDLEDDDSIDEDDRLEDSDDLKDENSIDEEDRLEDPEQDEDSSMEDEDKVEDPELDEDSIHDLSNMDRYVKPPAPPGHKGAPAPPGIPGKNIKVHHAKKSEYSAQINF